MAIEGGNFEYRFPGIHIQYSSGTFVKRDMMYVDDEEFSSSDSDPGNTSGWDSGSDLDDSHQGRYFPPRGSLSYDDTSDRWHTSDGSSSGNDEADEEPL
jgi:hypothetical protein